MSDFIRLECTNYFAFCWSSLQRSPGTIILAVFKGFTSKGIEGDKVRRGEGKGEVRNAYATARKVRSGGIWPTQKFRRGPPMPHFSGVRQKKIALTFPQHTVKLPEHTHRTMERLMYLQR